MNQPAKAQEPSMEEILASIRRIIADDDTSKPGSAKPAAAAPAPAAEAPKPAPAPPPAPVKAPDATNSQDDIDALFATFDSTPEPEEEPAPPPPPPPAPPVAAAPPPPPPPPAPAPKPPAEDILELTEDMRTAAPGFRKIDGEPEVVFSESSGWDARRPVSHDRDSDFDRSLLSASTSAAVDSAFNSLAQTVLVQNARTLEDLVREMLRPLLKSWLDDNLPQMVERMVRAEIERVSRGQR
ncbi:PopZ family protein [Rhodoplanes roseus]|uniref:Pole-organizing protein PopZ n=1 Tax=Rhodoplanes roseus TaxID=29409 RepID=A0A327L6V8_9BRAD|nr:DUF2497 domain-containing protein [Rhodoplanes roseus]RAI45663.1 hypothetical protein CH341_02705 [Rhodoplanes roseus]